MEWLETAIFPVRKKLTEDLIRVGTKAAAAEMIATGTTFACDMYFHTQTIGETLADTGVRATLCGPITDGLTPNFKPGSGDALRYMEGLITGPSPRPGRIECGVGTHSVYVCDEDTLLKGSELAKKTVLCCIYTPLRLARKLQTATLNMGCILSNISTP